MASGVSELMFATTGAKQKPVLDESSFQQLLAAAYVVQTHNDNLWAKIPQVDTASVLSEIAEMQAMAQAGKLDLSVGAKLITERLLQLVAATGVSLSLIRDGYLDCVAESGVPAKVPGSSLASHSLVATERLKAGDVFDSADSRHDMRLDSGMCDALGVGSLIAAPVTRFGELAGLIEVRWARPHSFDDTGLFASRLMAGFVAGILQRQVAPAKQIPITMLGTTASLTTSLAETRPKSPSETTFEMARAADELDAVEKKLGVVAEAEVNMADSQLAEPVRTPIASAESRETETRASNTGTAANLMPTAPAQEIPVQAAVPAPASCRVCGQPFGADEAFCGHCSMPRLAANPVNELQSKWASLWFIERAKGALAGKDEISAADTGLLSEVPNAPAHVALSTPPASEIETPASARAASPAELIDHFSYFEPLPFERNAESERQFWERAAAAADTSKYLLQKVRPKDIALVLVALILAFGVASAWPSSTGKLNWFGSIVVRMGLARHSVPAYAGNPGVNVWVDEQTSRYYCPGEDLYGKTSAGHLSSQLEAEQARIEPASGLVCR